MGVMSIGMYIGICLLSEHYSADSMNWAQRTFGNTGSKDAEAWRMIS
jgi:hypothetical protein